MTNNDTDDIGSLHGLLPEDFGKILTGEKAFRYKQLFSWTQKGILSFEEMKNIPKTIRERLIESGYSIFSSRIIDQSIDADGTVKLGIQLYDDQVIECVLLTDTGGKKTACLSSQVGCAMGCAFCRTGTMGLIRNLHAAEIVEQFHHLQIRFGHISHIVYMGMGEPLANLPQVQRSIRILNHELGVNIGLRRITVSTCGLADAVRTLADEGPHVKLAVSLNSVDPEVRSSIMPINNAYSLEQLHAAVAYFQKKTGRRVTFEYVLLGGVNDSPAAARELVTYIRGIHAVINVIPWNPGAELDFTSPSDDGVSRFTEMIERAGVPVTCRFKRGRGVNGACGQLAVKHP